MNHQTIYIIVPGCLVIQLLLHFWILELVPAIEDSNELWFDGSSLGDADTCEKETQWSRH
jgi:hypothetical protein